MRYFRVIGNTRYDHNFRMGQIVEFVREYSGGDYEVEGYSFGFKMKQDIHPRDLQEVSEEDYQNAYLKGELI